MLLDEASVTGTANIVMAAVLAKGTTRLENAAMEREITTLVEMMIAMGANSATKNPGQPQRLRHHSISPGHTTSRPSRINIRSRLVENATCRLFHWRWPSA